MENTNLTPLMAAIVTILGSLISIYILPPIKDFLLEKKQLLQDQELFEYVVILVQAAEQMFAQADMGKEKFDYVIEKVCKEYNIDPDYAKDLVESIVYEMNRLKTELLETAPITTELTTITEDTHIAPEYEG